MRQFMLGAVSAIALVGTVAVITLPDSQPSAANSETYRQLNLFGDIFERIRADYVEEVDDAQLIESAVNGMLTSLDPHSSFLNQKSYRDMQVQTRGEFGGLGIEVSMENGLVKVVAPIDDTPASRAGVKPGDVITHLDGQAVLGLTLAEAVEKMRGPVNSTVTLTVQRAGQEQPFDVTLTRAIIRVQSVRARREGDIGYIRLTTFNEQTETGLQRAMERLKQEIGPNLQGWVLDLRNNPGGLLDQAIAVTDAFLEQGEIVSTRGRRSDDAQRYNARRGDIAEGKPVVVLINGGSASASEIVAGALQDHRRALILGTRSFGKGSVQTIIPLQGHGAIRLTTARYYTPSGRSIQAKGIDPDIEVLPAKIEVIEQSRQRSEADLRNHLLNPTEDEEPRSEPTIRLNQDGGEGKAVPIAPGGAQTRPPPVSEVQPGEPGDYQLQRSLDMLRGLWLFSARSAN